VVRSLRVAVKVLTENLEPEGRAVEARLESGEEITVIRGVKERNLVIGSRIVLTKVRDRPERLVPDLGVFSVLEENLDVVAVLLDGLRERPRGNPLAESPLPG
jgi:hypothetical protein